MANVYVMRAAKRDGLKIGFSCNPAKRAMSLRTKDNGAISVEYSVGVDDAHTVERADLGSGLLSRHERGDAGARIRPSLPRLPRCSVEGGNEAEGMKMELHEEIEACWEREFPRTGWDFDANPVLRLPLRRRFAVLPEIPINHDTCSPMYHVVEFRAEHGKLNGADAVRIVGECGGVQVAVCVHVRGT